MKINLKNLTQTCCPICYCKLKIVDKDCIPLGDCFTINGLFYKKDIKKTDKGTNYYFATEDNIIYKTAPFSHKANYTTARLKLNNRMAERVYLHDKSEMVKYTIWNCVNEKCRFYKAIDEIEYDFTGK